MTEELNLEASTKPPSRKNKILLFEFNLVFFVLWEQ